MIEIDWVKSYIMAMIYVNTASRRTLAIPPFREIPRVVVSQKQFIAPRLSLPDSRLSETDRIISVLTSKEVRRGSLGTIKPFIPEMRARINRLVRNRQSISLILPSLPFKDQSPFTTGMPMHHTDLCEHAMFAQLKRILDAIAAVYEPGGHFTLLCDGYIYANIFAQGDTDGAGRYKANCEKLKNAYGLHNHITLFDMREIFFDLPEWLCVKGEVEKLVKVLYEQDAEVRERIHTLARRFMFHVALPEPYGHYEKARMLYEQTPWLDWLEKLLKKSAIDYVLMHLTLAHTKLVQRAFPFGVRCTVHHKPAAQFPLHLTHAGNCLLPYNGVAALFRDAGDNMFSELKIMHLSDILRYENLTACHLENEECPFFFRIEKP